MRARTTNPIEQCIVIRKASFHFEPAMSAMVKQPDAFLKEILPGMLMTQTDEMFCLQSNIGLVLHGIQEYDLSLKFLDEALKINLKYHGEKSLKAAIR